MDHLQVAVSDRAAPLHARRRSIWSSSWFQLVVGLLLACGLPLLLRFDIGLEFKLSRSPQYHSLIATALSVVLAHILIRRLTYYPGVATVSYVLPTLAFTYAMALLVIVVFRIDYSRFFLLASFILAQLWFHFAIAFGSRQVGLSFAVVPAGRLESPKKLPEALQGIRNVTWTWLTRPDISGRALTGVIADLRADYDQKEQWEAFLAEAAINGTPVYHYKQVGETLSGRVEIEHLSENTLGSLTPNLIYLRTKQSIDALGVVLTLPLLLPLFAAISVLIRLDSKGPVFFRQERIGYRGRTFEVWKFRTMVHRERVGGSERDKSMTADDDPRVTRVGRILRRSRLDELPQVINILRGEMSWIGPRPEAKVLSRWYENDIPFYRYRHIVRPGITGWAQVNQGHVADVDRVRGKLHYDFYYIKNFSIWLDLLIAIRTVAIVVTGFGAR